MTQGIQEELIGAVPQGLCEAILGGRCVAFVGAGFSAAARLPTWKSLLLAVADTGEVPSEERVEIRALLQADTPHSSVSADAYEQAAQLLQDHLGRSAFTDAVRESLRPDSHARESETMRARMRYLAEIPFRAVLTTNFDTLIEGLPPEPETYQKVLWPWGGSRWWDEAFWGEGDRGLASRVVKLHGDLMTSEQAASIVFTRRDYRRQLHTRAGYLSFLHALLSTSTVLFMGTSFEDAYLNELRSQVLALIDYQEGQRPVAYAILNDVPELKRRHFEAHEGINILSYSTPPNDHSGFDAHLKRIWEGTAILPRFGALLRGKRILWVDPNPRHNEAGYRFIARALSSVDDDASAGITQVRTPGEAIDAFEKAPRETFHLVVSHWGHDQGPNGQANALHLLDRMHSENHRCPTIVFGAKPAPEHAEANKRAALSHGAYAYCATWETLFRHLERLLSPGHETL
ncbi:MAG: SIR2 family NAD-dependent protein deacylase [Myxococcota bacterium]